MKIRTTNLALRELFIRDIMQEPVCFVDGEADVPDEVGAALVAQHGDIEPAGAQKTSKKEK